MKSLAIKIKNIIVKIKQSGIKGTFIKINNKIRYGKAVLDEYAEWINNNEPKKKDIEKQKSYISCQNINFEIICKNNEELIKSIKQQTYSKYKISNIDKNSDIENIVENSESDYIVFVEDNITLLPFTLYDLVVTIEHRDCMLIYSDNDKFPKII